MTFQGRTLAATCEHHSASGRCAFMVNAKGDLQRTLAWVVKWLIAGTQRDHAAHLALCAVVKNEVARGRALDAAPRPAS